MASTRLIFTLVVAMAVIMMVSASPVVDPDVLENFKQAVEVKEGMQRNNRFAVYSTIATFVHVQCESMT